MLARSVLRASTRVAPSMSKIARASLTTGGKQRADPFIPQAQIPTSSYNGGEVQRSTLTVGNGGSGSGSGFEAAEEAEHVTPLSRELYNSMPRNMQKMTLMDKVVVVTG